jgi:hypothetical protein
MAELATLVTGPARMPLALESMYAFPFRERLTATLSQGAVQYIRQTTPGFANQRSSLKFTRLLLAVHSGTYLRHANLPRRASTKRRGKASSTSLDTGPVLNL